jgi:hypothetical protein
MPIYCYRNDAGEVIELTYPMGEAPHRIVHEELVYERSYQDELAAPGRNCGLWPMYSDAAGCNPDQVPEMEAHSREIGIPTHFDSEGRAIFTSRKHRKKYCEAIGLFDRSGGYSDPQPQNL